MDKDLAKGLFAVGMGSFAAHALLRGVKEPWARTPIGVTWVVGWLTLGPGTVMLLSPPREVCQE